MNRLPEWLAVLFSVFGFPPVDSSDDTPPRDRPPPDPLRLYWLAEHLEALATDDLIPLSPFVRDKVGDRIATARRLIRTDPVSAAWTLRQAFLLIRNKVVK